MNRQQSLSPSPTKTKRIKLGVFGRNDVKCEKEFPSLDELSHFPHGKDIRLRKIYYKNGFGNALKAIRLEFTYGITSPLFEAEDKNHKLKSVEVDTTRTVRKISMNVCDSLNQLRGMRLIDQFGKNIIELIWCTNNTDCKWITQEVPKGQQIIGLQCNTKTNNSFIQCLGFILWTPSAKKSKQRSSFLPDLPKTPI